MRRRRWRTAVLWVGYTLCVLIVAAFVVSGWWFVALQVPTPYGPALGATGGMWVTVLGQSYSGIWVMETASPSSDGTWPSWRMWNHWNAGKRFLYVPLYAVLLAFAVPTLLVWRFVPKFPRGHCRRCGYNLTGLREARCPECGQPFEPRGDAP